VTKSKNKLFFIIPAVLALLAGVYCLFHFVFPAEPPDLSGWSADNPHQYLDRDGKPQLHWQTIDGKTYYFDPATGNMVTGWQEIDGNRYYFESNGVRTCGWLALDAQLYYLDDDGKMHTGWLSSDGKQYYFSQEGTLATGWQELDSDRYYFLADGTMATGWHAENENKYFFGENGKMHVGWLTLDKKQYFFEETGMMKTGWLTQGEDRYYLKADGSMAIGEVEIDGTPTFFTSKGKYVLMTNPWNPIPKDFRLNLVDIGDYQFDRSGAEALVAMINDCCDAGHDCYINNSYRSHGTQQYLWDNGIEKRMARGMTYEEALADTARSVAVPGHSEHETGLAVDIVGNDALYEWLGTHCWDYGFILRYPDDRIPITGIKYEPWHFRYVGKELSLELKELGLCMEEYITMLTQQANS